MVKDDGLCVTNETFGTGKSGRDRLLNNTKSEAKNGFDFSTALTVKLRGVPRGKFEFMRSKTRYIG